MSRNRHPQSAIRHRTSKILLGCVLLLSARPASAQWLTQSISLSNGWNAVFLHVDPSHQDLNSWVAGDPGNPITQIWRWNPPSIAQFVDTPLSPTDGISGWSSWLRTDEYSILQRLVGDTAYLVESRSNYTWQVKGHPVAPRHRWNIEGLNLIGFPTINNPKFDRFLEQGPELAQALDLEIYRYQGTVLTNNPILIHSTLYRSTPVKRGQAFWIRAGTIFNTYFGPFEVVLPNASEVSFGTTLNTYSLRLKNLSPDTLSISVKLNPSESVPTDFQPIVGAPPLLVRGPQDLNTHEYGYSELPQGASTTWTLAGKDQPGSEVEVVIGLDRLAMTNGVGSFYAGILRFTDSLGLIAVDVSVSGQVASDAGLWVGEALVTQVGEYLKSYQGGSTNPVMSTNGAYIVSSVNTNLADMPSWFPLRLIVHNPASGSAKLFHHVFHGMGVYSNLVISSQEAALAPAELGTARRISAIHLPWTEENTGWDFDGRLQEDSWITTTVTNEFNDQRSNPFLHTYHPDHDNLNSDFDYQQAQGAESYTMVRTIRLMPIHPSGSNFNSRVSGGKSLSGNYSETTKVIGLARAGGTNDTRTFESQGVFRLDRISDISTLTDPL